MVKGTAMDEKPLARSSAEIVQRTKQEIASTVRVYRKEWLWESRHPSAEEAQAHCEEQFGGRLLPQDVRVRQDQSTSQAPFYLEVRLWNVHTEWKDEGLAQRHAELLREEEPDREVEVVVRNSRREHVLRNYGVLKLPSS